MIECQQVKQLLPLWIGQDLPDASHTAEVAEHLLKCPECGLKRQSLQASMESLQTSAAITFLADSRQSSLWPGLSSQISAWENGRSRERFNGWVPATVMALAAALMVAVSMFSVFNELSDGNSSSEIVNLFQKTDLDSLRPQDPSQSMDSLRFQPKFVPTNFRQDRPLGSDQ